MLRITTSKNGAAAVEYFNQALSKQDYYSDEAKVLGTWHGKAAERLGLHGEVTKDQFEKLVHNRKPLKDGEQGEAEKLTPKDSTNRRAGYDFTFNAPKSVSIAHAINKDPKLLSAHQEAIRLAMLEVEKNMQTQNTKRGEEYITTGNALYALYDHELSRPVAHPSSDGGMHYVPDPHMHSHAFLFNATWFEDTQKFKAVELGNIKADAPYYEAIYHAIFRQEIMKAGYEIERTRDRWELKIIDRETIEAFSNRTKEIEQAKIEKGITNAKAAEKIGARTRHNKNKSASEEAVKQNWQDRLSLTQKHNINAAAGAAALAAENKKKIATTQSKVTPDFAVDMALRHKLQNQSSVSEKRVLAEALNKSNFTPQQIQNAYNQRQDILGYHNNTRRIITTREVLNAEKTMIAFAASQKDKHKALNATYEPTTANADHDLNAGQKQAVKQILKSQDGVMILKGGAGTGKTTISKQIREGIEQNNKSLFAFAPSTAARDGLIEEGFDAHTIKKLIDDQKLQDQLKDQIMFIDESGMVGVQTMNGIFDIAKVQNARVILSGDQAQHNSVEAGDAQRLLQERCGIKPAVVSQVVRQKNEDYKKAIEDLADGRVVDGFKKLQQMNAINEIEDPDERYEQLAKDYLASATTSYTNDKGETVHQYSKRKGIVVSPTHQEGQKVNNIIRKKLKERGLVGSEEQAAEILRPMHYTDSYKQDAVNYEDGLIVRMHYNTGGFKAGSECEVVGKDDQDRVLVKKPGAENPTPLPLDQYKKFSVYQKNKTAFAEGDTIQLTSNVKSVDGMALNNGNRYRIKEITKEGHRVLDNGATIRANEKFIKHGLYSTSMSAQGKTADDVFIAQNADSSPANNEKQFYVSTSRGAKTCRVYTDDAEDLLNTIAANDGNRESASEVAGKGAKKEMEQAWKLATKEVEEFNTKYSDYGEKEAIRPDIPGYRFNNWTTDRTASPGANPS